MSEEQQVKYGATPEERSKTAEGDPGLKRPDRRRHVNEIDTEVIRKTDLTAKNRQHG